MYSDPKSVDYPLFCKYQLVKFIPWSDEIISAWENEDATYEIFCEKWNLFLQSKSGQTLVPNWRRQLNNVEAFFSSYIAEESEGPREDWIYNHNLTDEENNVEVNE